LSKNISLILAGGKGTRLWPLSREDYPKQFVSFLKDYSLFQLTLKRNLKFFSPKDIYIISNKEYKFTLFNQIDALLGVSRKDKNILKDNLILEPISKNTLPAILLGLKAAERNNKGDFSCFVFPSDHFIFPDDKYIVSIKKSLNIIDQGYLVTFGISPLSAKPGYGYILIDKKLDKGYKIKTFVEKPSSNKAQKLINQGAFWNSRIFGFKKQSFLEELEKYKPQMHSAYNHSYESFFKNFKSIEAISIDYGLIQKTKQAAVVKFTADWSDLGSWDSFFSFFNKYKKLLPKSRSLFLDCKDCVSLSKNKLVTAVGLEDAIIIDGEDSILVINKASSEKVSSLVNIIKKNKLNEFKESSTVYRPWGYYKVLRAISNYKVKEIGVYSGKFISLQRHKFRSEHWNIVEGKAEITIGTKKYQRKCNQSIYVSKGRKHKVYNPSSKILKIIEVQIGSYLEEDDIERFDTY